MFGCVAKRRRVWPVSWMCDALGVSRSGVHAWLTRPRSKRDLRDAHIGARVKARFLRSDRTYGARRAWHDVLAEGVDCGLHAIERPMRLQGLRARPRRRRLPKDAGDRAIIAPDALDRAFDAAGPNAKWVADFTYVRTAERWLCVAVVIDLFSRGAVGGHEGRHDLSIGHGRADPSRDIASQCPAGQWIPLGTLLRNALPGSGSLSGHCFAMPCRAVDGDLAPGTAEGTAASLRSRQSVCQ